ncbi:carotenoid biosynthesis protein [Fulvivirga sp. RKSG066]|uniref:carotenoid biosynthesis protein n=1 Tax=Fulvivirga aurantia TaxID=2529383 RepID=UPI0012BCDA48|nr:carotenoid biosynthesis protein [Fulvivirga aurantia]MTI22525.1 carotenoid biosynthesis protein [Fulvivirga aurantia]
MKTLTATINKVNKRVISILILWLFSLSSIIGISMGHLDWFITKTPLNLLITLAAVIVIYPLQNKREILGFFIFFATGWFVEWLGVNYGIMFGEYAYGENLGIKIDGVPVLIAVNWAILILVSGTIAGQLVKSSLGKILIGATLMVFLDFFIEVPAPYFDYWSWDAGHVPLKNYITWFVVSTGLLYVYQKLRIKGDFVFSCHLYIVQLTFFAYFYAYFSL